MKRSLIDQEYIKDAIKKIKQQIYHSYYLIGDDFYLTRLIKCCFVTKDLDTFKNLMTYPYYYIIGYSTFDFIKNINKEEYKDFIDIILKDSRTNLDSLS